jgi:hypothetical protein
MRRPEERRPRTCANLFQSTPKKQAVEFERVVRYKKERKREFRRKHEERSDKIFLGVHMPRMAQAEMQKAKIRLADLLKTKVNPLMRDLKPRIDDWEDWQVFEKF